jgi:hypothetical protein
VCGVKDANAGGGFAYAPVIITEATEAEDMDFFYDRQIKHKRNFVAKVRSDLEQVADLLMAGKQPYWRWSKQTLLEILRHPQSVVSVLKTKEREGEERKASVLAVAVILPSECVQWDLTGTNLEEEIRLEWSQKVRTDTEQRGSEYQNKEHSARQFNVKRELEKMRNCRVMQFCFKAWSEDVLHEIYPDDPPPVLTQRKLRILTSVEKKCLEQLDEEDLQQGLSTILLQKTHAAWQMRRDKSEKRKGGRGGGGLHNSAHQETGFESNWVEWLLRDRTEKWWVRVPYHPLQYRKMADR